MWTDKNIHTMIAVFFIFLVISAVYHQEPAFPGSAIGHSFGIAGTVFIFMALIYPFRKRVLKKKGKQNPLNTHITYGLVGPSLAVIHSAHKFASLIGTLIFLALVIVVLSGITGRFLYRKVNRALQSQEKDLKLLKDRFHSRAKGMRKISSSSENKLESDVEPSEHTEGTPLAPYDILLDEARTIAELEYSISFFDRIKRIFSWWIQAHYLLSAFLFALIVVHVLTTLYYGLRWLP